MEKPLTEHIKADGTPLSLKEYEKVGGYQGLKEALKHSPEEVLDIIKASNLRGRGGAGFPTGLKWSFVPMGDDVPGPKYVVVNGDEMEPGTFKDRLLLETNPHQLIEGMIIAAYTVQAEIGYMFIRWAYHKAQKILTDAIQEAYDAGYLGKKVAGKDFSFDMLMHSSVGRYICGEETALLNALEGKRANPRSKPPFPQVSGLFGKPTVLNNVETYCNVPHILRKGTDWYNGLSKSEKSGGTKLMGASGRVKNPGVYELPIGITMGELIEEHAGGMQDGYEFKAVLPGGGSTDFLTKEHFDVPMDFEPIMAAGSRMGTALVIIMDDKTCPVGMCHNLVKFFAQESCGWCTPCREGLPWATKLLEGLDNGDGKLEDIDYLIHQTEYNAP